MKIVMAAGLAYFFWCGLNMHAEAQTHKKERKGELYFSWGYNKEWYTKSNVSVSQPALGNDYKLANISGHDHPGWDDGIFNKPLSVPQYNYRLGYTLNKSGWGFEINFDHTKFIFADQDAHVTGKLNNKTVDTTVAFNQGNGFYYYLNNGANFLLFNVTKRHRLAATKDGNVKVDFFGKLGIGPVIPHVQNELFGNKNDPHFQFGGWNVGAEAALRGTFYRYVYLELANKVDYARYSGLKVYQGTARQAFGTYEWILSLGFDLPMGRTVGK